MTAPFESSRPQSWRLTVERARRETGTIVRVAGRISGATAGQLADAVMQAADDGEKRIVVDLEEVDYISSAGLMVLEASAARLRTQGAELVLCGITPPVRTSLELGGLLEFLITDEP